MDKILLLIDQRGHSASAFNFSCFLAGLTNSSLTGIFLDPEPVRKKRDVKKMYDTLFMETSSILDDLPDDHWKTQLGENKRAFALACSERNIRWADQVGPVSSVDHIVHESRFADLLVLHAETHLSESDQTSPSETVREILARSECPVVVAPIKFSGISKILFAYDGTASAVHAIKQFTYLFPALYNTRIIYVEITGEKVSTITDQVVSLII